jgi:hypothetical protein
MCPAVDNLPSCEIHAVVRFLYAKNMSAVEIHCQLCAFHGQNVMSEGIVRQWRSMFKDGRAKKKMFTMKSEVVSDLQWVMVLFKVEGPRLLVIFHNKLIFMMRSC